MEPRTAGLATLVLLFLTYAAARRQPVDTIRGPIRGITVDHKIDNLPAVTQYLGIPYTRNPMLGNTTFSQPTSPTRAKWEPVFDATKLRQPCIQNFPDLTNEQKALKMMPKNRLEFLKSIQQYALAESQDCLFLNFYVPEITDPNSPPLPVIVFIHGESYEWNTGNAYDPSVLAALGKLIVVTLNYRLGAFGFLSSGKYDENRAQQGNQGLSDVIAALEQVKGLVRDFGGDKDAITLMGEGSGAAIVQILMTSTVTAARHDKLFHRAILLSGSALNKWAVVDNPAEYFYLFATKLGCKTHDEARQILKNSRDIMGCILTKSISQIQKAQQIMPKTSFLPTFGPVVDGAIVQHDIAMSLTRYPKQYREFDLMIGLNSMQGRKFLSESHLASGVSTYEREKIFRTLVRNLFSYHRKEILDAILNRYTQWAAPKGNTNHTEDVIAALTDGLYCAALVKSAQIHASQPSLRTKTYMYVFESRFNTSGEDLAYILGHPISVSAGQRNIRTPYLQRFRHTDAQISRAMIRYISNFAETGDPKRSQRPSTYDPDPLIEKFVDADWRNFGVDETYLHIGTNPAVGSYYRAEYMAFWNDLLEKLDTPGHGIPDKFAAHHLLPGHTDRNRYFGDIYPDGGFHATLPPPTAPIPPPAITTTIATIMKKKREEKEKEMRKKLSSAVTDDSTSMKKVDSTMLSITVAIGCTFLILNVLVLAGIYHQRDKQKKERAKLKNTQPSYNSYENSTGGVSPYINLASASGPNGSSFPPPPPPPGSITAGAGTLNPVATAAATTPIRTLPRNPVGGLPGNFPTITSQTSTFGGPGLSAPETSSVPMYGHSHVHRSSVQGGSANPGSSVYNNYGPTGGAEHEPLLRTGGICPRHGKPVQPRPIVAASTSGMEEIQV